MRPASVHPRLRAEFGIAALLAMSLAACAAPSRGADPAGADPGAGAVGAAATAPKPAGPPEAYLLYDAATQGDYETVRNLLADHPKLAKLKLERGTTPLHASALCDDPRIAEAILAAGAYVDARGGAQQVTPLFLAAMKNHPRTAKVLLDHRANPGAGGRASLGEGLVTAQPLHVAALAGGTRLVQELLAHGADVNARSGDGGTAADCAAQSGHFAATHVLAAYRRYGAVKARPMGELLAAIDEADSAAVEAALAATPAIVNTKLGNDVTPLHVAADRGDAAVCRVLLAHGADPTAHEQAGGTPAVRASNAGHPELSAELHAAEVARRGSGGP